MHIRSWTPEKEEICQLKKRLERPKTAKMDIISKINMWKEILNSLYDIKAVKYTDMPHGTDVGNPTEEKVVLIYRLQSNIEELEQQLQELEREMQEFDNLTTNLNQIQKNILTLRYIEFLNWEQISSKINYSRQHCIRIHDKALEIIIKFNQNQ